MLVSHYLISIFELLHIVFVYSSQQLLQNNLVFINANHIFSHLSSLSIGNVPSVIYENPYSSHSLENTLLQFLLW